MCVCVVGASGKAGMSDVGAKEFSAAHFLLEIPWCVCVCVGHEGAALSPDAMGLSHACKCKGVQCERFNHTSDIFQNDRLGVRGSAVF